MAHNPFNFVLLDPRVEQLIRERQKAMHIPGGDKGSLFTWLASIGMLGDYAIGNDYVSWRLRTVLSVLFRRDLAQVTRSVNSAEAWAVMGEEDNERLRAPAGMWLTGVIDELISENAQRRVDVSISAHFRRLVCSSNVLVTYAMSIFTNFGI